MRHFSSLLMVFLLTLSFSSLAQQKSSDWTVQDLNSTSWNLYSQLDSNKTVFIDISATWCGLCWQYHKSNAFKDAYNTHGPGGSNKAMFFFFEGDPNTNTDCLYGKSTCNAGSSRDWVTGSPYPMVDLNSNEAASMKSEYDAYSFPSIVAIFPDRTFKSIGRATAAELSSWVESGTLSIVGGEVSNATCGGKADGSISVTVNGGAGSLKYAWSNGANTKNLSGVKAGSYTLTVTDQNGISKSQSYTIEQPQPIVVQSNKEDATCGSANGSISINASGGNPPYQYDIGTGFSSSSTFDMISPKEYVVNVKDASNCVVSDTLTISSSAGPSVVLNLQQYELNCRNKNVVLDASKSDTSGNTLSWTLNGTEISSTDSITVSDAGVYTCTITDGDGCTASKSVTVTKIDDAPTAVAGADQVLTCSEDTLTLTATGSEGSYHWSTMDGNIVSLQDTTSLIVDAPGTYVFTVTTSNLCTASDTVRVTQSTDVPTVKISVSGKLTCSQTAVTLDASGSTSGSTISYLWQNESGESIGNAITASATTPGNYTLTVRDTSSGCASRSTIKVLENKEKPTINASKEVFITCNDKTPKLSATVTGTDSYEVLWSTTSGNIVSGEATLSPTIDKVGTYTLTVTDNNNGCQSTDTVVVTEKAVPPSAVFETSISDRSVRFTPTSAAEATYQWTFGDGNSSTEKEPRHTYEAYGSYEACLILTNECGVNTSCTTIEVKAFRPYVSADVNSVSCYGATDGSINVQVRDSASIKSYTWSHGPKTQNVTGLAAGQYNLLMISNDNRTQSVSFVVPQPDSLTASVVNIDSIRGNIDITISGGTTPYTILWSNGATSQNLDDVPSGTYSATITDSNGCTTAIEVGISIVSSVTSVEKDKLRIYPNPMGDNLTIDLGTEHSGGIQVSIYSVQGSLLWQNTYTTGTRHVNIDSSDLKHGVYVITIVSGNQRYRRLVSKR